MGLVSLRMPDLVWMDISMPGMNGWEVVEHIRDMPEGKKSKVVVVTASLLDEDRVRSASDLCVDIIRKPYS